MYAMYDGGAAHSARRLLMCGGPLDKFDLAQARRLSRAEEKGRHDAKAERCAEKLPDVAHECPTVGC